MSKDGGTSYWEKRLLCEVSVGEVQEMGLTCSMMVASRAGKVNLNGSARSRLVADEPEESPERRMV